MTRVICDYSLHQSSEFYTHISLSGHFLPLLSDYALQWLAVTFDQLHLVAFVHIFADLFSWLQQMPVGFI